MPGCPDRGDTALDCAVFDLDGVVTRTAAVHAAAWKEVFDAFLQGRSESTGGPSAPFDIDVDYRVHVDGKPRLAGVRGFLAARGITLPPGAADDGAEAATEWGVANAKNRAFRRILGRRGVRLDDATIALIKALRAEGLPVAVASSSRNCGHVLALAGIETLFDARVDGNTLSEQGLHGKPEPDLFLEAVRRLGMPAGHAVLFEDSVVGVEAGRIGRFGLIVGIDRGGNAAELQAHGADVVVTHMAEVDAATLHRWFADGLNVPALRAHWDDLERRLRGKRPAVFLDYDGTLTPIVERPELAILAPPMRARLSRLATLCPVAIVSGRDRADVERIVGLDVLAYAGSHGFDIAGPGLAIVPEVVGADMPVLVAGTAMVLAAAIADVPGAVVEPKRYGVSVHYRQVADDRVGDLRAIVARTIADQPRLRCTGGKKVIDVRPNVDWDKGRAVLWLLQALDLATDDVLPIYVGDDGTDEDAFAALRGRGVAILNADRPRSSAASFRLTDPDEVGWFIDRLIEFLERGR